MYQKLPIFRCRETDMAYLRVPRCPWRGREATPPHCMVPFLDPPPPPLPLPSSPEGVLPHTAPLPHPTDARHQFSHRTPRRAPE